MEARLLSCPHAFEAPSAKPLAGRIHGARRALASQSPYPQPVSPRVQHSERLRNRRINKRPHPAIFRAQSVSTTKSPNRIVTWTRTMSQGSKTGERLSTMASPSLTSSGLLQIIQAHLASDKQKVPSGSSGLRNAAEPMATPSRP